MLTILNLTKTNKLILAVVAFLAVMAFGSGRAHAATLNVTGGCTLPIAIDSVNAGANQSGCTATGAGYGTSDTITIPAGTITLTATPADITEDVVIEGAGMNSTTIDGDAGQFYTNLVSHFLRHLANIMFEPLLKHRLHHRWTARRCRQNRQPTIPARRTVCFYNS